jgi:hypothetical protein
MYGFFFWIIVCNGEVVSLPSFVFCFEGRETDPSFLGGLVVGSHNVLEFGFAVLSNGRFQLRQ